HVTQCHRKRLVFAPNLSPNFSDRPDLLPDRFWVSSNHRPRVYLTSLNPFETVRTLVKLILGNCTISGLRLPVIEVPFTLGFLEKRSTVWKCF
ncbi:MAG TPA: hypothetical protein DDY45_05990, partial [Verrucomicrobiales bacterium]|nr:hypothetical protein [Verrucomicrobiales bacterium]